MRHETLVAFDFDGGTDITPVLDFVADALIDHEPTERPHWRTGEPVTVHLVTFDAHRVRNTEVHGAGYRAGFVVHVE